MGKRLYQFGFARAAEAMTSAGAKYGGPVRIVAACAAVLSFIVVSSAAVVFLNLRDRVISDVQNSLLNSSLILAKQIEQTIATVQAVQKDFDDDLLFASVSETPAADNQLGRYTLHQRLRHVVGGMPYVASLAILDPRGRVVNSSQQWPAPAQTLLSREYLDSIEHDTNARAAFAPAVRDPATGRWILPLAHRVFGSNGELIGIVWAGVELGYLQRYFSEINSDTDASVALFRDDGTLLARNPSASDVGRRYPNVIAIRLVVNFDHGVGESMGVIDPVGRTVAAHRISGSPLVMTATKTTDAIAASWRQSAVYIAGASLLIIAIIAAFAFLFVRLLRNYQDLVQARVERNRAEQLREQSMRFDVALHNMSQGLVMFDAQTRIVVVNRRFIEIYGVSPEVVKPGLSLLELLRHRKEIGSFSGDPEVYFAELQVHLAKREVTFQNVPTPDGRTIKILNRPMPNGGWVATHEDITAKVAAENQLKKQEEQLNAALEHISQGVCMFDSEQRLIICNHQYAELYGLTDEQTKPGTPLATILQHRIAMGHAPEDHESYIRDRLNEVAINQPYETVNRLRDGRYVAVVHRPMSKGGWVATHHDITDARRREESFRLMFEGNPVPMWVIDRDTFAFLAVNEAAVAHYGYSREQFLSMTIADLRPREDRERFLNFMRSLDDDQLRQNIGQHIKADGSTIDVSVSSKTLTYEGHRARLAAVHDITQTKNVERELRRTQIFLDEVIEHVPVPIVVRDVKGDGMLAQANRFTLFNKAYEQLTGDSREQLIGKTAYEIYAPDRAEIVMRADREALQAPGVVVTPEHEIPTAHHGTRLVVAKKTVIRDETGTPQHLLTVLHDVTDSRRAEQQISYLAHNDSLTGLPNRASFLTHVNALFEKNSKSREPFAVMCLDLDRFKEANDVYGHLVGDGLLREVARRLQAAAQGAFLARIGGDEFMVVLESSLLPEAAEQLGERLLGTFKNEFLIDGHRIQVGLSIGIATFPADGNDVKSLIANADAALYQAKSEVRGSLWFFDATLGAKLREQRELQADLRVAMEAGELFLHYQPQFTIATDKVLGLEALVRWQSPKRGLVPPSAFIPVAEQSGLIIPLGEWILCQACREAASWPNPIRISVNISPVQFHHGDLPRLVHSVLLETGLRPDRLELEITEGVLIDDFSRAVSILNKLRALGIHIALDDFGSGYSSLSYLHAFPFEKIKIDRAFVGDLENNHHSMAIVRAIINLGHSLDIPILAEGVETPEQLAFLAKAGCDEVQGYLLGRPSAVEDYAQLVGRPASARHKKAVAH
jgi:diguanylate cyclase (GGDEF)-like protein/PAS domain S-box-containing protein